MTETKHDKNKILMVQKRKRGIDFMLLIENKKMLFHNFLRIFSFANVNFYHLKFEVEFCLQICINQYNCFKNYINVTLIYVIGTLIIRIRMRNECITY